MDLTGPSHVLSGWELRLDTSTGLPYVLALPRAPQSSAGFSRHPLLCFLHGYDEGAPMPIDAAVIRHGPLRPENTDAVPQLTSFIVVAPQIPERGDVWRRYGASVRDIVDRVQGQHGGDRDRTYLTGFSFGGNGVFDLALDDPGPWAALWAVDPTRVPRQHPTAPVWLSFGEVARFSKPGFVRALRLSPAGQDAHGPRMYLDEGADHVGSAALAYADPRIYNWLLSIRR